MVGLWHSHQWNSWVFFEHTDPTLFDIDLGELPEEHRILIWHRTMDLGNTFLGLSKTRDTLLSRFVLETFP
jgi:hypothetical protein